MKLLLDENLSRHLVTALTDEFPDSTHVTAVGLVAATDTEIWDFARQHDFTIVSKDSDFNDLAFVHGTPPKVIWLRLGNRSTDQIARLSPTNTHGSTASATTTTPCLSSHHPTRPPDNHEDRRPRQPGKPPG